MLLLMEKARSEKVDYPLMELIRSVAKQNGNSGVSFTEIGANQWR